MESHCSHRHNTSTYTIASGIKHTLQWRHNERDGVSNHQRHHCLLTRLFRHRSKIPSKLGVTGLCVGNLPVNREFPAQRASNAENVFLFDDVIMMWLYHQIMFCMGQLCDSVMILYPFSHHWEFVYVDLSRYAWKWVIVSSKSQTAQSSGHKAPDL